MNNFFVLCRFAKEFFFHFLFEPFSVIYSSLIVTIFSRNRNPIKTTLIPIAMMYLESSSSSILDFIRIFDAITP